MNFKINSLISLNKAYKLILVVKFKIKLQILMNNY